MFSFLRFTHAPTPAQAEAPLVVPNEVTQCLDGAKKATQQLVKAWNEVLVNSKGVSDPESEGRQKTFERICSPEGVSVGGIKLRWGIEQNIEGSLYAEQVNQPGWKIRIRVAGTDGAMWIYHTAPGESNPGEQISMGEGGKFPFKVARLGGAGPGLAFPVENNALVVMQVEGGAARMRSVADNISLTGSALRELYNYTREDLAQVSGPAIDRKSAA